MGKQMTKQELMTEAMQIRDRLFDIANAFAGNETGDVAIYLHESCNWVVRAKDLFERHPKTARNSEIS